MYPAIINKTHQRRNKFMSKLTFKEDEYSNLSDSQRGIIIALTSVINIRIVTQESLILYWIILNQN